MWWIRKQDRAECEYLMRQGGAEPVILAENEDLVQVGFTANVMNEWQMLGYWIG